MQTIILVIALLLAAFLVFVSTRPNTFSVKRAIVIKARPAAIYPLIDNFHPEGWGRWSPWEGIDPELKRTYSGPHEGVGSVYEWEGNNKVGSGRMEIQHAEAPMSLEIKLDFFKPMKNTNRTVFQVIEEGEESMVTWTMSGPVPFVGKIFHLFMNMDGMVGGQFDQGLQKLKAIAEAK